jgi:chromate reductase, NAD(P)H dehydrogenase (quinone)
VFVFLNMHPINGPEVIVTFAHDKFDANGKLIDENTSKFLKQLLENLANWTRRLRGESSIKTVSQIVKPKTPVQY